MFQIRHGEVSDVVRNMPFYARQALQVNSEIQAY